MLRALAECALVAVERGRARKSTPTRRSWAGGRGWWCSLVVVLAGTALWRSEDAHGVLWPQRFLRAGTSTEQ